MKKVITGFVLAGLFVGCGGKSKREPTVYEQTLGKLEGAIAQWERQKKKKDAKIYSYSFYRPRYILMVDVDAITDKPLCRKMQYKLVEDGESPAPEYGADVNSNDWGDAPKAWVMPELHADCRRIIKEKPDAWLGYTYDGSLLWCEDAFGYPEGKGVHLLGWGINEPKCEYDQ